MVFVIFVNIQNHLENNAICWLVSFFNRIFSDKRKKPQVTPQKQEPTIVVPDAPTPEYASLLQFDFMTNDLSGGILPILKCDCCKDGYLIVRTKDRTPFLGCTNYKADKSGCNRKINLTYYENMLKRGEIEL